ncbi:hypothetical protein C1H46_040988 [Malus baccata]|uniref:Uncharacterized protein n=1 Tax=Malus baccata TaxID=106549 RepID=A0A540KH08_MALBA|nr:hypothetical protein C1H46_040988 [Malus baccata]
MFTVFICRQAMCLCKSSYRPAADAEFALRLELHNQEIKKQYTDAKSSYDKGNTTNKKQEMKASVQEVASQAASKAKVVAAEKNVTPPTTAYQFEVSWRGLSGDSGLQASLLKV